MTYERLAYDDAATTTQMRTDAAAAGRQLGLQPSHRDPLGSPVTAAPWDAPVVSNDLAELAAGLELHFD